MDFQKLIPDFSAIGRTNWAKPNLDTKNIMWLVMAGAALLMLIFVFLPWFTCAQGAIEASRLGITLWYGIFGLIFTLVTIYGVLYNQLQFVFWGAVLAAVMGLIGWLSFADVTAVTPFGEVKTTAAEIEKAVNMPFSRVSISHTGAILFFFASVASAVVSFLQIKNAK